MSSVKLSKATEVASFAVLYLHGFGSSWKPDNPKACRLASPGRFDGLDLDYRQGADAVLARAL